jgi:N-methylhydantoinase B
MIAKPMSIIDRDPVTFEVVRSALYAICAEMKSVIMRTSFSPLLSLSADLSCALLDSHGKVVAQGRDIPVHLGAAPFTVRAAFDAFPIESWKAGDGVILNDPYSGGTHLPDVSLIMPIFQEGALCGFSLSRVHWPDVGGIAAGSSSVSDEIFKEGIRIPPLRIIEGHSLSFLRMFACPRIVTVISVRRLRAPIERNCAFASLPGGTARTRYPK